MFQTQSKVTLERGRDLVSQSQDQIQETAKTLLQC
jgi:hypothetical protein